MATAVCKTSDPMDSFHGIRRAGALLRIGDDENYKASLCEAERWFGLRGGTSALEAAAAHQIAGAACLQVGEDAVCLQGGEHAACPQVGEYDGASFHLQQALFGHLLLGNHAAASVDAEQLSNALNHLSRFVDQLSAAELSVREARQNIAALAASQRGLTKHADPASDERPSTSVPPSLNSDKRLVHAGRNPPRPEETAPPEARRLLGRALLARGNAYDAIGDLMQARASMEDAYELVGEAPDQQVWIERSLGELMWDTNNLDRAVGWLQRAHNHGIQSNVPRAANAARLNLARLECQRGHFDAARHYLYAVPWLLFRNGALHIQSLLAKSDGDVAGAKALLLLAEREDPEQFFTDDVLTQHGQLAEATGDLAAAAGFYRAAIERVEKQRADTSVLELRPWMLAGRRKPYGDLLGVLLRMHQPEKALEIAEQLHFRTALDALADSTPPLVRAASGQVLMERLRSGVTANLPTTQELLALARRRDVLVFATADHTIWRFHIVDGAIREFDRLPEDTETLAKRAQKGEMPELALRLGDALIPAAARVPSQRPLYIVADDELRNLPFAALRPDGRLLVNTRVLARLPGMVTLRCHRRPATSSKMLFVGDSRGDLREARAEVTALARRYGGEALVGENATVGALRGYGDIALEHFAIHAEKGKLLLAHGELTVADVIDHKIAPRIAVLAGCNTGNSLDSEGWGAMSNAFLVAGSHTVIGTLVSVPDAETKLMMQQFYAHGGMQRPAEALAAAQQELSALKSWPYFVAYGSAEPSDCDTLE